MRKRLLLGALSFALAFAYAPLAGAQPLGSDAGVSHSVTVGTSAYASGDALGSLQTIPVFRSDSVPAGILNFFWITSKGGSTPSVTVYLFDTKPSSSTTCTDNSAFSLAAADRPNLVVPPFALTLATIGTGDTATYGFNQSMGAEMNNKDSTPTTDIYMCLVTGTAFTPGSTSDIAVKLGVSQD